MALSRYLLLGALLGGTAMAQLLHPESPMPVFSVISIRPTDPGRERPHNTSATDDAYRAVDTTLSEVMTIAFGLGYEGELINAPAWVKEQHFDIEAKLDDSEIDMRRSLSRDDRDEQMRLMMQSMLAERFRLKYHFETRNLGAYRLAIAKSGLKCPEDTSAPHAIPDMSRPRFRWFAAPAPPPPPRDAAAPRSEPALTLRTRGWPFWLVVSWISHQPELDGKPVVDTTGLTSSYDCQMAWTHAGSEETGEFFFAALERQLGLRLQPAREPIEVLVVDRVDRPSAN